MEGERGSQTTIQAIEEVTATEQELSSPDTPAKVLQRVRRSEAERLTKRASQTQERPGAIIQSTQERRQETVAAEQKRSSPAVQTQVQEREETSQLHTAHTLDRGGKDRRKNREKMPTFVIKYTLNYCRFVGIKHLYRIDLLLL